MIQVIVRTNYKGDQRIVKVKNRHFGSEIYPHLQIDFYLSPLADTC